MEKLVAGRTVTGPPVPKVSGLDSAPVRPAMFELTDLSPPNKWSNDRFSSIKTTNRFIFCRFGFTAIFAESCALIPSPCQRFHLILQIFCEIVIARALCSMQNYRVRMKQRRREPVLKIEVGSMRKRIKILRLMAILMAISPSILLAQSLRAFSPAAVLPGTTLFSKYKSCAVRPK